MKLHRSIAALAAILVAFSLSIIAQTSSYRISGPHTHKNLSFFLIHGKNETNRTNIIALPEAVERKILKVYETSDVNELEVENVSRELDVFIQSGDIVKGGKQDRVLAVSIIIPARSGRVKIDAFCVESGRWQKRNSEDASQFSSANERIISKDLKLAANAKRSQSDVWEQVAKAQRKLSDNVGASVASRESASSLQLSLENQKITETAEDYIRKLSTITAGRSDVIGFAIAINGRVNSADVYVSNDVFKRVWPRMLRAAAIEAVAESRAVRLADPVKVQSISSFLADAERAKPTERRAGSARLTTREDDQNAAFESRDERANVVVHRSYVKKN